MGKWPPLSWFPVPLGTPVWLSGWDPGSSPLPPSRLRANLAPHLAQMYPLLPAPHPTSGLPQASFSHAAVRRTFPKSKLDHDSPAADPSQEASRYWPGLQGLVQLGPCLPLQAPLHLLPAPQLHPSCQDSPHPSAPAIPSVWNALAAACFVSPRILLLVQQGPAQRALLQADFPNIQAVVGFSSWA